MSKPVFSDLLTPHGRRNRKSYLLIVLALAATQLVASTLSGTGSEFLAILGFVVLLALIVPTFLVAAQRLHDLDRTGWWVLLGFVPIVNIILGLYLLMAPGTPGPNSFGPDPRGAALDEPSAAA